MDAPKMMATRIGRRNFEVVCALIPQEIYLYATPRELYGRYLVINEPVFYDNESMNGVLLTNRMVNEEDFKVAYSWSKNVTIGCDFVPIRHRAQGGRFRLTHAPRFGSRVTYTPR
jgi:hypothetical protein